MLVADVPEFEVEDILDVRVINRGRHRRQDFLVKWQGYGIFDSTWEPESNLTNCPDILSNFLHLQGLSSH